MEADPSLFCLQADLVNAFNLVNRDAAMEAVLQNFPEVLAWVKTCYGAPSVLKFGPADILVLVCANSVYFHLEFVARTLEAFVATNVIDLAGDKHCHQADFESAK